MTSKMQTIEEVVEEFNQAYKMCDVAETTGTNTRETSQIYIEKDKAQDWLRATLQTRDHAWEERVEEAKREALLDLRNNGIFDDAHHHEKVKEAVDDYLRLFTPTSNTKEK